MRAPSISRRRDIRQRCSLTGRIGRPVSKPLRRRRDRRPLILRAVHLVGALVRSVAAGAGTRLVRGSERHSRLLHRLLHQEPDGSWTWRVRGAKVPATRTTDVCLLIEPAAAEHYCPDCLRVHAQWYTAATATGESTGNGERFVAVSFDGGMIMYSADGNRWERAHGTATRDTLHDIAWG